MAERKSRSTKKTEETVETTTTVSAEQAAIAEELNALLGCDPAIPVEGDVAAYDASMKEAAALLTANDEKDIKPETWAVLLEAGLLDAVTAAAEAAAKETEAAPEKKKRTPPTPPKRYSRQMAMTDVLKSKTAPFSMTETITEIDSVYVKNGGKSNIPTVKADFDWLAQVLVGIGAATMDKDVLDIAKK